MDTAAQLLLCSQVLHIDRNNYYGGQSASLNLNQVHSFRQGGRNIRSHCHG